MSQKPTEGRIYNKTVKTRIKQFLMDTGSEDEGIRGYMEI